MIERAFIIKAVLFDFDGTLTKPGAIDFNAIRKSIGCPAQRPILEYIESLKDPALQADAHAALAEYELNSAVSAEPNPGAEDLISYLLSKHLPIGIISRNGLPSIKRALRNFKRISEADFDLIISRDDPVKPKPSADGVLLAAESLNVDVEEMLMVGDYVFDIEAGKKAGAITVLLSNGTAPEKAINASDFTISYLQDLKKIIRLGIPLPCGKLPNEILGEFLEKFKVEDPSVIIYPGIGEDVAAMNIDKEEVLVLKSDPITFATDSIGHYAVLINANDIATSGATPRWFLTSLLFPSQTTASAICRVMEELITICRQWGITLCGGHTEITDAVNRPVVTGMLAGTVARKDLVDKQNIQTGDTILLTKGVAVEGTAIIAREFGERLKSLGLSDSEIETCRRFLSSISILEEAQIASRFKDVSAMHDVTEGGLATALKELSIAGSHRIKIDMDGIPVFPQTVKICRLLDIDPLGLIGSGSLLISCRRNKCEPLVKMIRAAGIDVSPIGEVLESGEGIEAWKQGRQVEWPCFEVDEITRLF